MQIKPKETVALGTTKILKKEEINRPFKATLLWQTAIDLDLYCMYKLKDGSTVTAPVKKGLFAKIGDFLTGNDDTGSSNSNLFGTVYFSNKGSATSKPFIKLDQDAGIGDTGGDNEENMTFHNIDKIEHAIIVANIFAKTTNFSKYNARVVVQGANTEFEVPLTEKKTGSWCVVARIDNSGSETKLINVNKTMMNKPNLRNFI